MTKSAFEKFNAYLPYHNIDILSYRNPLTSLQDFSESADSTPSEEANTGSEANPTPKEDVSKSAEYGPRLSDEKILNPEDNVKDCTSIKL